MKVMHAWWSAEAYKNGIATVVWANAEGKEVELCIVTSDKEGKCWTWKDRQYLGQVVHYLRAGRSRH